MPKRQHMVIVNRERQPDGTWSLSVTWTNMTEDEQEAMLADLAEHFDWPQDEDQITPLAKA